MLRRLAVAAAAVCTVAVLASPLRAASPQFWRIEGAKGFLEGDLSGLSLDSEGRLRLGPSVRQVYDPAAPNAWAVTRDAKGVLYVGTGNDGRVMKIAGGSGSLLFDSEELEVHAVAVAPDGRVFAGTSPDGAVYAIDAAGKATRFFDPEEKYIWALVFDASGSLYVATGGEGRVYKVDKAGKGSAVLTASDTHVLSLAIDRKGRLFAGSAPEGIVYRVDAEGKVFVVLDSSYREIRALDVAEDGSLYAAAIDARAPETTRSTAPTTPSPTAVVGEVTVTESFSIVPPGGGAPVAVSPTAAATDATAAGATTPKGAVLRIRESGDMETIWSSPEDVPHALALSGDTVLVGTGNKGKVYRVTAPGEWSLVATVAAEQVTALAAGVGFPATVVTSNPARVYALDGTLSAEGTFTSKVKDVETLSAWGQLSWEGVTPAGTSVKAQTRLGNTPIPDATWTDWGEPLTRHEGAPIGAERARFVQVRLTLGGREKATPMVESIAAAYLPRNLAPEVKSITVHPPGEVFQKPISVSGDPEILGLDPDPVNDRSAAARTGGSGPAAITFSRKMYQRGLRTISWQADDPNGDPLVYDVHYRAVGDDRWRPLRSGLTEPVIAWDTSTVPNGRYLVRILASDAPGNPPANVLTGSRDGTSFEVDNTPPVIAAAVDAGRKDSVRATARDDSPIRKLEVSIDAGRWEEALPRDGIADSPQEEYEISLPPAAAGKSARVVILRVADILGNVATVRVDAP